MPDNRQQYTIELTVRVLRKKDYSTNSVAVYNEQIDPPFEVSVIEPSLDRFNEQVSNMIALAGNFQRIEIDSKENN